MKNIDLKNAVRKHSGIFHCVGRSGDKSRSKAIHFAHVYDPPVSVVEVPDVGMLKEFYETFGSLTLYYHKESKDAAFYIANPRQWSDLSEYFQGWVEDLDEEEQEELLPDWLEDYVVIGEIPQSGNYILVPTSGEISGHIIEFEHDGFEFVDHAKNLYEFIETVLEPDCNLLTNMASHMTFIENDPMEQWWIEEMHDNKGRVVTTEA